MIRFLALLVLVVAPAFAQLSVFIAQDGSERPLQPFEELNASPAGSSVETRFRVRNDSGAAVTLDRLAVAGDGFSIGIQPELPRMVPAGNSVEFSVRFAPAAAGSYSANLSVNESSYIIRALALPSLSVLLETDGRRRDLQSGYEVDFGSIELGSNAVRRFVIENRTNVRMPVMAGITGVAFRWNTIGIPAELDAGGSAVLEVAFYPELPGEASGTLNLGALRFVLAGTATEPPLPELRISVNPGSVQSGQQVSVTVSLADAAPSRVTGELTLAFIPDIADVSLDAAVQFAGGGHSAAFEIGAGQSAAAFGTSSTAQFQTGTTAGTLILSARAGSRRTENRLTVARAPVRILTMRASRNGNSLDVNVVGLDNVRTAAQVSYTFFDTGGAQIGQAIRVDAREALRTYFQTSAAGGAFALRAVFPVTGDATQIGAVEMEITNSAGASLSERIRF